VPDDNPFCAACDDHGVIEYERQFSGRAYKCVAACWCNAGRRYSDPPIMHDQERLAKWQREAKTQASPITPAPRELYDAAQAAGLRANNAR